MSATREPILTPRLRIGLGLLAFGLGFMFLCGKVLPAPVAAGIAGGIALATAGFVVAIVESLRESPQDPAAGPQGDGTERPEAGR